MTVRFNAKKFLNKERIYRNIPGSAGIDRLHVWCDERKEYLPPRRGKSFRARRYEVNHSGRRTRIKRYFDSLENARHWQAGQLNDIQLPGLNIETVKVLQTVEEVAQGGVTFADVVSGWKKKRFTNLADTTQIAYEKIIRLHLQCFFSLSIHEVTPEKVDAWLDQLKDPQSEAMKCSRRLCFRHELEVLSAILRYYEEYHSDRNFYFPIKKRHWRDVKTDRKRSVKAKDFSEVEFLQFREKLSKCRYGSVLAALATVQYFEALRISEAAAIFYEDIRLDLKNPKNSRLLIQRSVFYPRKKGLKSSIKGGFKNSKKLEGGIKELPIFPQAYEVLVSLVKTGASGLIFSISGEPIEYRTIQYYYDKAFREANLPYTATHVLRHGWTREVFNRNLDFEAAKQLLGDTSDEAARVYAVRQAGAITGIAQKMWNEHDRRGHLKS